MPRATQIIILLLVCIWSLSACNSQPTAVVESTTTTPVPPTAILTPTTVPVAVETQAPTQAPILSTSTWTPVLPTQTYTPLPLVQSTESPSATPEIQYGVIARQHLEALSNDIGARLPGSEEEARAAEYIQTAFDQIGYKADLQPFTYYDEEEADDLDSSNVIAIKEGLSTQQIIVGAHYDSSDEGVGADDNASGVAVMLEAAELVFEEQTPYTIVFIAFGAEENDLNGSKYYVTQMSPEDIGNTVGMVNLDSLIAGDLLYVYGDSGEGTIRDWIMNMASGAAIALEAKTAADMNNSDGSPCDCADYGSFQEAGIQFAYFEATNWNLGSKDGMTQVDPQFGVDGEIRHTEYDTVSKIDALFPGRINHHLNLFVTLLYNTLTRFGLSE